MCWPLVVKNKKLLQTFRPRVLRSPPEPSCLPSVCKQTVYGNTLFSCFLPKNIGHGRWGSFYVLFALWISAPTYVHGNRLGCGTDHPFSRLSVKHLVRVTSLAGPSLMWRIMVPFVFRVARITVFQFTAHDRA